MERTTVMLPPELKAKAAKRAGEMGMSLGQFIRDSVKSALHGTESEDSFFTDEAVFQGAAPADLAGRHDDYLYEGQS